MTDDCNEKITMALPTESSIDSSDRKIELNQIEIRQKMMERNSDIQMYKKLICAGCRFSKPLIVEILGVLASSNEIGDERVLLGSLAFTTILSNDYPTEDFTNELTKYWSLQEPFLSAFGENYQINNLEWFKLVITHGYLQVNTEKIHSSRMIVTAFDILHNNCLRYTKYSYVAYKILHTWLEKTWKMNFWVDNETSELESRLEAIIFSNWDNCMSEIVRRNASQIFPTYLKIMCDKYDGFLQLIFENCVQNLSWQNVTKYAILVEVCKMSNNLTLIINSGLKSCIFTSLTKNHLKHAGTLLYLTILGKITANEWKYIFGEDFFRVSARWESEKEFTAIDLLWEQWMKPTVKTFPSVFQYLWENPSMKQLKLSQTYLEKIGAQQSLELIYADKSFREVLNSRIVDISETVRLNAFAVVCRGDKWNFVENLSDPFDLVKRFLYFNANATTIFARRGIIENFKIFFARATKIADANANIDNHVCQLIRWLHEFSLNCFEIGSSYQRKILGLSLYGVILNFMNDNFVDGVSAKSSKYEATLKCANALKIRLIQQDNWKFVDRTSAISLLKLVIDQMVDVRDKSTLIITRYFDRNVLTDADKQVLLDVALEYCNSSKIHEIAGGCALIKILLHWKFIGENFVEFFYNSATKQMMEMRKDILKSAARGSSFFGPMNVILEIGFTDGVASESIDDRKIREILNLIEEATSFFLSALSLKDNDCDYASSFKEMSIAVEVTIRNSEMNEDNEECILSPAHQLVVSCIWMSLKVSCELAAEIGCRAETDEIVTRAAKVIVSVLLKCRHKGAIEAAGLALAKLTKASCKGKYEEVMKKHLTNLLNIDSSENINLTRRGAGLTIMFHRIVSSDDRTNPPFVHYAMGEILNSLRSINSIPEENCENDLTCARHLHFLRSLVADKGLQSQLIRYMEDVCLLCFVYLQSPEWTVRNASLQLFGAIVARLVGQCSPKELDYGIGNSINHFLTHYPILAKQILDQLEIFASTFDRRKDHRGFIDLSFVSKIVPILTLLSKMSTGGCDLVDYSSKNYIVRGKKIFVTLFAHPVFHVRVLAAKAFAAFVPLADIRYELTIMKMRKINWHRDNYNHGQLLAQFYLKRKYEYETKCTSGNFTIRKHENYKEEFEIATRVQLARAGYCWRKELYKMAEPPNSFYTIHNLSCFSISALLLNSLIGCPIVFSILSTEENTEFYDYQFISSLFAKKTDSSTMLGLSDFLKNVIAFKGQFLSCPFTRRFYTRYAKNFRHHEIFRITPKERSHDSQLDTLITDAFETIHDLSENHHLEHELLTILEILNSRDVSKKFKERLITLSDVLKNIDGKSNSPCAENISHIIAIDAKIINEDLLDSTISYAYRKFYDKNNDDVETKYLIADCLSRLVVKIFNNEKSTGTLNPVKSYASKFICVVTALLTDEDAQMRESTSDKLRQLTQKIIGESGNSVCSRFNLQKILYDFSWLDNPSMSDALMIFQSLTNMINIKESKTGLRSPYEEDETFQRDDTELLNILFYCVTTLNERISLRSNDFNAELQQIDDTIIAKYELQRVAGIDLTNIENYLKLSTWNYLSIKKYALIKIIMDELSTENQYFFK